MEYFIIKSYTEYITRSDFNCYFVVEYIINASSKLLFNFNFQCSRGLRFSVEKTFFFSGSSVKIKPMFNSNAKNTAFATSIKTQKRNQSATDDFRYYICSIL